MFQPVAHPEASPDTSTTEELSDLRDRWGTQDFSDEMLAETCSSIAGDPDTRAWFANWLRVGASPAVAYALNRAFAETDLREILPAVRVPTLVFSRAAWEHEGRDVAERIPGARLARASGDDYGEMYLSPEIVDEIARFVAGEESPEVPDSVLAALMFTDIVDSTRHASELGDRAWRDLLGEHHARVRRELARFRGTERDTAGDGFFATFDGPARAIRCGHAIVDSVADLGLETRIGVHVGECEVHEDKVAGIAVSIGARVAAAASAGEVLVSGTVRDLVAGSGLAFDERGEHELKGVPGRLRLFAARAAE